MSKTSKMIIFQPTDSGSGSWVSRASPRSSGMRLDPPQTGLPSIITGPLTHTPTLTQSVDTLVFTSLVVSGMWEETGIPGENLCRQGRPCSPQTVALAKNQFFSL